MRKNEKYAPITNSQYENFAVCKQQIDADDEFSDAKKQKYLIKG